MDTMFELVIVLIYLSLGIELVFFSVKSEVSAYRFFKGNKKDKKTKDSGKNLLVNILTILSLPAWIYPLIALFGTPWPFLDPMKFPIAMVLGGLLGISGRILTILGTFKKRKNPDGLITGGIFKWSRHPIATGMLTTLLGLNLIYINWFEIGFSILFIIVFHSKIRQEEKILLSLYREYMDYCKKTPRYLCPQNKK